MENQIPMGMLELAIGEFNLSKVVLNKDKSLTVDYYFYKTVKEVNIIGKGSLNYEHQCTQEFQDTLHKLHEFLCKVRNIKDDDYSKQQVTVKGIILCGDAETENFQILGNEVDAGKRSMSCHSAKIHYEKREYDWVEDVREIADKLEEMCFAYLFLDEKAQLSLELNDAEEIEENIDSQENDVNAA